MTGASVIDRVIDFETITSFRNQKYRALLALHKHRQRRKHSLAWIEGIRPLSRYIQAATHETMRYALTGALTEVLSNPSVALPTSAEPTLCIRESARGDLENFLRQPLVYGGRDGRDQLWAPSAIWQHFTQRYLFPDAMMDQLTQRQGRCDVIAIVPWSLQPISSLPRLLDSTQQGLLIVIDAIEKPGNLGSILRIADGVGALATIVCGDVDIGHPGVIFSSMGGLFSMPVMTCGVEEIISLFKKEGVEACCAHPDAEVSYFNWKCAPRSALVVGREDQGLSPQWLKACECEPHIQKISLPMRGMGDSLNVASATSVFAYEYLRQSQLGL